MIELLTSSPLVGVASLIAALTFARTVLCTSGAGIRRPAMLLASVDFVEPSPAEKADQDALNIEVAALAEKRTR